jgi:MFS family permease
MSKPATSPNKQEMPLPARSIAHAWRALRYRNFQLFFAGQSISVIGTWMTRLATSWLVYRLTHSALLLGVVGFAGQIISFALGPLAGVWVERLDRRKLLVSTQAAAAVQSLGMAALTLAHVITLWEIIALTALQGLINAFDMPARKSFLVQMVEDRNDLSNAIAINSSMANGAHLIGPAIAGAVIGALGEGWCFLIDGISYFAVIAALMLMRIKPLNIRRDGASMWEQMREGWDYVRTFPPIRTILALFALVSLMGYSYTALLPIFAAQVLHGGAYTLGWLTTASGVGGAGVGAFAGDPQIGRGADTNAPKCVGDARSRADSLWPVAYVVAIAGADGFRRLRHDPGRLGQQYRHPGIGAR